MNCEELTPYYDAYALGIVEEPEHSEIALHLTRNCPNCVRGVRQALELTTALSVLAKDAEPPAHLRDRVGGLTYPIRAVVPNDRWTRWLALAPWGVVATLAAALATVLLTWQPRSGASAILEEALSILSDPSLKEVSFGQPAPRGRVFVSPDRGIAFIGVNLPPLGPDKTFELWLIPAVGRPIPVGTFRSQKNAALYIRPGPAAQATAVAVTIEPAGGSAQPTTTPFIVARL